MFRGSGTRIEIVGGSGGFKPGTSSSQPSALTTKLPSHVTFGLVNSRPGSFWLSLMHPKHTPE